MARKKAKRSRRRNPNSIKLLPLAEAYLQFSVLTDAAFKTNPWDFVTAGTAINPDTRWTGQGQNVVSLRELITWPTSATGGARAGETRLQVITNNLSGDALVKAAISSVGIGVGFKFGKKLLRKPISQGNRLLKMAGLESVVKI